eukprot:SAG22_NODE_2699_length_2303_cov_1.417423_2_plen_154_part_01
MAAPPQRPKRPKPTAAAGDAEPSLRLAGRLPMSMQWQLAQHQPFLVPGAPTVTRGGRPKAKAAAGNKIGSVEAPPQVEAWEVAAQEEDDSADEAGDDWWDSASDEPLKPAPPQVTSALPISPCIVSPCCPAPPPPRPNRPAKAPPPPRPPPPPP